MNGKNSLLNLISWQVEFFEYVERIASAVLSFSGLLKGIPMYNYVLGAQAIWREHGSQLRWKYGERFTIETLIVNGEIVNMELKSEDRDPSPPVFHGELPSVFQEHVTVAFMDQALMSYPDLLEHMMSSFFFSIIEEWERKVYRMEFKVSNRNMSYRINIYDAEDELVVASTSKLFHKLLN